MSNPVKCLLIETSLIISEIEELDAEIGNPDCKLIKPYRFFGIDKIEPWVEASNQTE